MCNLPQNIVIKGLIFDMDGVLVDTSPCHSAAYEKMWSSLGIDGPEYSVIAGRSTKEVISEFASHLDEEQLHKAIAFKQAIALEIMKTAEISYADTMNALEFLHAKGLPMIVATSASKASAELALRNAGIEHFFSTVITSADVEHAKPAPDLFLAGIEALALPATEVLIFEDSQSGITAALASKANVVAVRSVAELHKNTIKASKFLGSFDDVKTAIAEVRI